MLSNLKLIFIHGVNEQVTNYSHGLFELILSECRKQLSDKGMDDSSIHLDSIVQHETMWADITTDIANRYHQLNDVKPVWYRWPFSGVSQTLETLIMQIMHYIHDKGDDKDDRRVNILEELHKDLERIFSKALKDVGENNSETEHVIIIAHSLGSVIAFDYLFAFRNRYRLRKNVIVKSLITMGSPIPLFVSAQGHPDSELKLPHNVENWVNIYSSFDPVARIMDNDRNRFFKNILIKNHKVWTAGIKGIFPIEAHTGYWNSRKTAAIIATEVISALYDGKK